MIRKKLLILILAIQKAEAKCDNDRCPPIQGQESIFSCGVVISGSGEDTKCGYLIKPRDKFPVQEERCRNMEIKGEGIKKIKTGDLVSISSQSENDQVYWHIANLTTEGTSIYYPYAYIGLRTICNGCPRKWTDKSPYVYENWYGSDPNTYYYECTEIYVTTTYAGRWLDYPCSNSINAFCQFYPNRTERPSPPKALLPPRAGCKEGWWPFAGYCYKIVGYTGNYWDQSLFTTYANSNSSCNSDWSGAMVALMPTWEHNQMVAALLGPNFAGESPWVGIYNFAYYDYYFSHVNQADLAYTNWETGKPHHLSSNSEKCVQMNWRYKQTYHDIVKLGQWENIMCSQNRPYVCSHEQTSQFSGGKYPTWNLMPGVNCPNGWIPYHSGCYKLFMEPKSFQDARKACKAEEEKLPGAKYSDLMTVWDDYELAFSQTFLRDDSVQNRDPDSDDIKGGYWIGLHNLGGEGKPYWIWVDNWPVAVSNWAPGKPDSGTVIDQHHCARMDNTGHFWNDKCGLELPYLCKAEFVDYTPSWKDTYDLLGQPLNCSDGWEELGSHCYRAYRDEKKWNDAKTACEMEGATLASVHSSYSNRKVQQMFSKLATQNIGIWIGFTFQGAMGGFQWVDRSEFSFTNWAKNEPSGNYDGSEEECGEMWQDGNWNDQNCNEDHPYVCKKLRLFPNCEQAKAEGVEQCGFPGMSEQQCIEEWGCCYNPAEVVSCFKPKQAAGAIDVGMAAGAAVGVLFGCLFIAAGGFFYYKQYGFSTPFSATTESFQTPFAGTENA